jgi:predicted aspartyl protease
MIDLIVSVSGPRMAALMEAGQAVPAPQTIRGLVDTGASNTCVDPSVLTALQLQPTGSVPMLTPSTGATPMSADTYDVGIYIPNGSHQPLVLPNMQVSACELAVAQGFHALVGRDILSQCILVYNGSDGTISFSY